MYICDKKPSELIWFLYSFMFIRSIEESISVQRGIPGGGILDWGHRDSDQLWLGINLCSALIGRVSGLAITERSHWPALSTDLYHRSGPTLYSNPRQGSSIEIIFNRMKCTKSPALPNGCGLNSLFLDLNLARQFWPRICKVSSARQPLSGLLYLGQL